MENKILRQDAWSDEDDVKLAEIALRHIREGSTQLKAFDEAAKVLNRTPAACGFRWNSEVRKRYVDQIIEAKQERKSKRKLSIVNTSKTIGRKNDLDLISKLKSTISELENMIKQMSKELKEKDKEIESLKTQLEKQKPDIEEDYQQFLEILKRAREMGVLERTS